MAAEWITKKLRHAQLSVTKNLSLNKREVFLFWVSEAVRSLYSLQPLPHIGISLHKSYEHRGLGIWLSAALLPVLQRANVGA